MDAKSITRDPNDEAFHSGLQCCVLSVSYDFRTRTGRLDMEGGDCCDMSGAIAFFEAIDPEVRQIETFSGAARDTAYVKGLRGWQAAGADESFARELRTALTIEGVSIDGLVDHMSARFELTAARRAVMREAAALIASEEELAEWLPETE